MSSHSEMLHVGAEALRSNQHRRQPIHLSLSPCLMSKPYEPLTTHARLIPLPYVLEVIGLSSFTIHFVILFLIQFLHVFLIPGMAVVCIFHARKMRKAIKFIK